MLMGTAKSSALQYGTIIAMTFCANIQGSQRMNPTDYGDFLFFYNATMKFIHLAFIKKIPQQFI